MRTLVSVQTVLELNPIPEADKIEVATVLGWQLVVKKWEFQVGDKCVYFEIDSLLPVRPCFEFLNKGKLYSVNIEWTTYSGIRLKTIKLRGQYSQGLALPLSVIEWDYGVNLSDVEIGSDITDLLNVVKWEKEMPASLSGKARNFPSFLNKTDETRIQSIPNVLETYVNIPFYVAEKLDGSSATFYKNDWVFGACSRNLEILEDEWNSFWNIARTYKLMEKLPEGMCIQGELVWPWIQENKLKLGHLDFYMFNAYDIKTRKYYSIDELEAIGKELNLKLVPIVDKEFYLNGRTVKELLEYADRKSTFGDMNQEWFVFRPVTEIFDKKLGRLSFKAISPSFLVKYDE